MEFFDAVRNRRSYRSFTAEVIPDEVLDKALEAALLAPNSSNMQPWEFYRVRDEAARAQLVKACFSQPAASSAKGLVVAVCRTDTWKRNQGLMLTHLASLGEKGRAPQSYYKKVVPLVYQQGAFGLLGFLKYLIFKTLGFFRPVPRGPFNRDQLFSVLAKTTALACENFMLAMSAQGFATCPMEGFDEVRVKKILGLNRSCQVVMIIASGRGDPSGLYGEQLRFPKNLFLFDV